MASIKLVGYLRKIGGFDVKQIRLTQPTPLNDLIVFPNFPNERLVILINEKGGKLHSLINDTDEVKILPVVGGG